MTAPRPFLFAALLLPALPVRRNCVPLPDPRLQQQLWGCSLASESRATRGHAGGMRQSGELQRLALDAEADATVFTLPARATYRIGRRTPPKEFAR